LLDLGGVFESGGNCGGVGSRLVLSLDGKPQPDFDTDPGKSDQDGQQHGDRDGHRAAPVAPKSGRYIVSRNRRFT
jgi:hypothetical protein